MLKRNGKLILLVTVGELIKTYSLEKKKQDPTETLLNKVDDLLMELDK